MELNPRFTFAMNHLGDIRRQKGDLAGAERFYRKSVELAPKDPLAHSSLGQVLELKGDLAGAKAEYRKAIELDPKISDLHNRLGWFLQLKGDLAGAEAEYRKAIKLGPIDSSPRKNLALVQRVGPLLPRLDEIVAGRAAPASPAEAVNFALLCTRRFVRQYTAAARLFDRAFAADPAERAKAAAALDLWLRDGEEFGVGPGKSPGSLPADEHSAWDTLWADVRATLERAKKPAPAAPPAPKSGTASSPGG